MMVLDDLKDQIPLREISRISGISLSGYYYRPRKCKCRSRFVQNAGTKEIRPI